jgi:hypothetical protein
VSCEQAVSGAGTRTYAGPTWNLKFQCIAPGYAGFTLIGGTTLVRGGTNGATAQQMHAHQSGLTCGQSDAFRMEPLVEPVYDDIGNATFKVVARFSSSTSPQYLTCNYVMLTFGCYKTAQWDIDYDQARVRFVGARLHADTAGTTAAQDCTTYSDNGSRVLATCAEIRPHNGTRKYVGNTWELEFQCVAGGRADFHLQGAGTTTVVMGGQSGMVPQPITTLNDGITCLTGDPDGDGMPSAYETAHVCLNPNVADANFDADYDGLSNQFEYQFGTDPCSTDTDGDGCGDGVEIGSNPRFGGDRDPFNRWDYFDVTGDQYVDLSDVLDVLGFYGKPAPDGSAADLRDRDQPDPLKLWRSEKSDSGVDLTDALVNLSQFGHRCTLMP